MGSIQFTKVTPEHFRIFDNDGCVGDVFRQPDLLNPSGHCFVIHLDEDPRGFVRVFDRSQVRDVAQARLDGHPFY